MVTALSCEVVSLLNNLQKELGREDFEIYWLTSVEGEPIQQTADMLGMTPGAVYIARSRVMARLKHTIQRLERR